MITYNTESIENVYTADMSKREHITLRAYRMFTLAYLIVLPNIWITCLLYVFIMKVEMVLMFCISLHYVVWIFYMLLRYD